MVWSLAYTSAEGQTTAGGDVVVAAAVVISVVGTGVLHTRSIPRPSIVRRTAAVRTAAGICLKAAQLRTSHRMASFFVSTQGKQGHITISIILVCY